MTSVSELSFSQLASLETYTQDRYFTVVGSGVIGLLVAKSLIESGYQVEVISNEFVSTNSPCSTSTAAGAQFLPWLPEDHYDGVLGDVPLDQVVEDSRQFYEVLSQDPHHTGVMAARNVELASDEIAWPVQLTRAMHTEPEELDEAVEFLNPKGEVTYLDKRYGFDSFSINTPKTISYLASTLSGLGVKFTKQSLGANDLESIKGVIINAAGIGAHQFDPGKMVNHYKGHSFILRPHDGQSVPTQILSADDLIILPREDGTVACGALYITDPERPVPEQHEATELQERLDYLIKHAHSMVDGLKPSLLENSDILVHSVGYRVELAEGGMRIACDETNDRLVHAYGFGGVGWSLGPYFAKVVASLAIESRGV